MGISMHLCDPCDEINQVDNRDYINGEDEHCGMMIMGTSAVALLFMEQ